MYTHTYHRGIFFFSIEILNHFDPFCEKKLQILNFFHFVFFGIEEYQKKMLQKGQNDSKFLLRKKKYFWSIMDQKPKIWAKYSPMVKLISRLINRTMS